MWKGIGRLVVVAAACACAASAQASIVIDTVPVGNPGNAGELSGTGAGGWGDDRICGAVGYTYNIGKYEVTAGQYTAFLNAVAGVDTYGLYNTYMWSSSLGCKIERYAGNGTPGSPYQYRVANDDTGGYWADLPVNYVSFWDSCRFANWLHNGQPTGAQGPDTTETGAYTLTSEGMSNNTIARNSDWRWAVTGEDEWYKAAYHKNDGATGNYWDYPTTSYSIDTGMANYNQSVGCTTNAGAYGYSSPYGTFDQGGNVWEWNETIRYGSYRGFRGGSFIDYERYLHASDRSYHYPDHENYNVGFRVSVVPEPATMVMLALAGLGMLRRR